MNKETVYQRIGCRTPLVDNILLILILFLFYFLWLGSYPLFIPDEGRYSEIAREMLVSGDYITPRNNGLPFLDKPVLHYWLQVIAFQLVGLNEWAVRLFPAAFAIFGVLITYYCTNVLYNRRIALLAAALLATSPLYFLCAHYADLNMEVAILISSALLCFIAGFSKKENSFYLTYFLPAIFIGLACLAKGLIGLVFPVCIISTWLLLTKRLTHLSLRYVLLGLAVILMINLPWYYSIQQANPQFFNYFFLTQQFGRYLSLKHFNNHNPFWFYVPVFLLGFFPWSLFLLRSMRLKIKDPLILFFIIWVAFIFVFFSIPASKLIGYILPVFPALAILTAYFVIEKYDDASSNSVPTWLWHVELLFFIFTILLTFSLLIFGIKVTPSFKIYLFTLEILQLAIASFVIHRIHERRLNNFLAICFLNNILVLLTLVCGASLLNVDSWKKASLALKTRLKPDEAVFIYHDYFQDIPLYMQQIIKVPGRWTLPKMHTADNGMHQLWMGLQLQQPENQRSATLINDVQFWQTWESDKQVYLFLHLKNFVRFHKRTKYFHPIFRDNKNFVISNHPAKRL